jgi:hypothetical protein
MIARARHVTRRWHGSYEPWQQSWVQGEGFVLVPRGIDHTEADQVAVRVADYLRVCSCYLCGNPRRVGNDEPLTRQERRSLASYLDQLRELDHA